MKDKFAALESPSWPGVLVGGFSVIVLIAVFFVVFRWPTAAPEPVTGTVESSGAVSVARVSGATREAASIRLDDGRLVIAQVGGGGPLSPGDKVRLLEQSRILGEPAFQVVAKVPSP